MKKINVRVFNAEKRKFELKKLSVKNNRWITLDNTNEVGDLYISPGFIDSHTHIAPGTDVGIAPDDVGLKRGVHLVIDAGSTGSTNYTCFRDYVIPPSITSVKAFLGISKVGLVSKHPYFDERNLDVNSAIETMQSDKDGILIGIKVLSSSSIVEDKGILPMQKAVEAAEAANCPIMAHLTSGPPTNDENMGYLRKGDIISHIFHGIPNIEAALVASGGKEINYQYYQNANIMWNEDGSPVKALERALLRGVFLDVGHGAASFDQRIARSVISAGIKEFSISSDVHIRNINGVVKNLPHVMSKFLSLGMTIDEVISSVTVIPSKQLGLGNWCENIPKRATIFRIRPLKNTDPLFCDSYGNCMDVTEVIEPLAVVVDKEFTSIADGCDNFEQIITNFSDHN